MTIRNSLITTAATAALSLLAATAAFAGPADLSHVGQLEAIQLQPSFKSTVSREQVRAQVLAARADNSLVAAGELAAPAAARPAAVAAASTTPRAEVQRATLDAIRAGQLVGAGEGLATAPAAAPAVAVTTAALR